MSLKSHLWQVTSFDVPLIDRAKADTFLEEGVRHVRFATWKEEVCETTGRHHVHIHLEFRRAVTRAYVQETVGDVTAHCEIVKDRNKDILYVRKPETTAPGAVVHSVGDEDAGGQGRRNDLRAVQKAIDDGMPTQEVARQFFPVWVQHHRALDLYRVLQAPRCYRQMEVHVHWGPAGTGKTHAVFERAGLDNVLKVPCPNGGSHWFDGYTGQSDILLDDYYGWLPWAFFLQLLDKYPLLVPTKGGHVDFISRRIWITSNAHPRDWYKFDNNPRMSYDALRRRITHLEHFDTVYVPPEEREPEVLVPETPQRKRVRLEETIPETILIDDSDLD